uniref:IST1 homolog n=2 Tax=Hirondellea gigas TaxID=1518452 RepID=A0A2P2I3P8_9CRUS
MFSSGPSYAKLKTNLRLAINRLKLLEKKKTELAQKARKEIADYIAGGKVERAKIRVEHIIREDYLVEAMEVVEMYCDLILARFSLIQQMKDLDAGMSEAISSLVWSAPRLMTDVPELKVIADQFTIKYGKQYAQACKEQSVSTISEKLIHKLSVQAPPKVLVEKYLQEIASNYNLEYTPDPQVLREADFASDSLINFDVSNNLNGGGSGGAGGGSGGGGGGGMNIPVAGGGGYPDQTMPQQPFSYPPNSKAAEAMASGDLNLPNVPGMTPYPAPHNAPPPPFNYPTHGGGAPYGYQPYGGGAPYGGGVSGGLPPHPAVEPGAGTAKPNNTAPPGMHQPCNSGGGGGGAAGTTSSNWDEMLGLDTSPPPPYASIDDNAAVPPSAPPPSLPSISSPQHKPQFPPDIGTTSVGANKTPEPAPRSKFDENTTTPGGGSGVGFSLPDLPNVPSSAGSTRPQNPSPTNDEIDFDDLNKRFQELKKK